MAISLVKMPEVAEIAELCEEIAATERVGKANRLHGMVWRRLEEIDAHAKRFELLRALLTHPSAATRMAAIRHCGFKNVLVDEAERAAWALAEPGGKKARDARGWLERRSAQAPPPMVAPERKPIPFEPAPAPFTYAEVEARIAARLGRAPVERVRDSLMNCIRLWPKPADADPLASRLGGLPALPEGFDWPRCEGEPMLFLAQINCGTLKAAVGENPLPASGLLLFFGDEDETSGCGPYGDGAVVHFESTEALTRAAPPVEEFHLLPECGLEFFLAWELPDPKSDAYPDLKIPPELTKPYAELRRELLTFGAPRSEWAREFPSKLFGWPELIQRELEFAAPSEEPLLLQLGWFHDGVRTESWGPGGLVYFALAWDALGARQFNMAAMEMQCT